MCILCSPCYAHIMPIFYMIYMSTTLFGTTRGGEICLKRTRDKYEAFFTIMLSNNTWERVQARGTGGSMKRRCSARVSPNSLP